VTESAKPEFARPGRPKVIAPPPPRKKRRRRRNPVVAAAFVIAGLMLLGMTAGAFHVMGLLAQWEAQLPPIASADDLWHVRRTPGMTFLDSAGAVLSRRGPRYGQAVHVAELPLYVRRAFLAAEDVRYYEHGAIDPQGIARALYANFRARRTVQGASTLTQQLARTLFLTHEESLQRKVQEMMVAGRLEGMLGKDGVLDLYLNRTFFGDNAYGLEAASQVYFGRPAAQLTLAQSALLAAVPNAPSRLALTNDMAGALARSRRILGIMLEQGWITRAEYADAVSDAPQLYHPPAQAEGEFAYVIDLAARQAQQLNQVGAGDLIIQLTVDSDLQRDATAILRNRIAREGRARNATQAALVALAPDGAVRAMVGGVNYEQSVFNRAVQARRQPGSAFKPIVFAAALERGVRPSDLRDDAPIRIGNWSPQNYGGRFSGHVTIQQALARSINTVAVRLGLEVGTSSLTDFARRLGLLEIPSNAGPSIALGAYEVSPLSLAGAYQVFQSGGRRMTPYVVARITDTRGNVVYQAAPGAGLPVYDPTHAGQMVRMMQTVITQGTGRRAGIGRPAAGKTGTSQNWRDAWFVGFTPDWLAAVWVGNDNGHSMAHVTGGEIPAEIWHDFMIRAHRGVEAHEFTLAPEPPASEPAYTPDQNLGDGGDSAVPPVDAPDNFAPPNENPYEGQTVRSRDPLLDSPLPPLRPNRPLPPVDDDRIIGLPPLDEPQDLAEAPRRPRSTGDEPRRRFQEDEPRRRIYEDEPRPRPSDDDRRGPDMDARPRWEPDDPDEAPRGARDTTGEEPVSRSRY
jgi:penicillin-binding protein 1A